MPEACKNFLQLQLGWVLSGSFFLKNATFLIVLEKQ